MSALFNDNEMTHKELVSVAECLSKVTDYYACRAASVQFLKANYATKTFQC